MEYEYTQLTLRGYSFWLIRVNKEDYQNEDTIRVFRDTKYGKFIILCYTTIEGMHALTAGCSELSIVGIDEIPWKNIYWARGSLS